MDMDRVLGEAELMTLYGEYNDALQAADLAGHVAGDSADEWQQRATERVEGAISDVDALEVNVYLASTLLADRYAIVSRLRAQSPPMSWAKIGAILGMSRQSAHEWFGTYNLRPRTPNPTALTSARP